MININIRRKKEYKDVNWKRKGVDLKRENSTIGTVELIKDGKVIYKCYSCENGGASTDEAGRDRRIIAREYKLYETESGVSLPKKFLKENGKKRCISLYTDNLPSFKSRRIHIHIGNAPQDTEGCILFGEVDNKNGTIANSTNAILKIYDLCFKEGLENCLLNIIEI